MQKLTSPRLDTIKMVEKILENMDESLITIAELKRRLPKQVNHNTLMVILDYLDESNKIHFSSKGITWLTPMTPELRKMIAQGTLH